MALKCGLEVTPGLSCIMCQCGLAVRGHVGVATQASGVLFMTRRGTRK